jgi:hypothetical protein
MNSLREFIPNFRDKFIYLFIYLFIYVRFGKYQQ